MKTNYLTTAIVLLVFSLGGQPLVAGEIHEGAQWQSSFRFIDPGQSTHGRVKGSAVFLDERSGELRVCADGGVYRRFGAHAGCWGRKGRDLVPWPTVSVAGAVLRQCRRAARLPGRTDASCKGAELGYVPAIVNAVAHREEVHVIYRWGRGALDQALALAAPHQEALPSSMQSVAHHNWMVSEFHPLAERLVLPGLTLVALVVCCVVFVVFSTPQLVALLTSYLLLMLGLAGPDFVLRFGSEGLAQAVSPVVGWFVPFLLIAGGALLMASFLGAVRDIVGAFRPHHAPSPDH